MALVLVLVSLLQLGEGVHVRTDPGGVNRGWVIGKEQVLVIDEGAPVLGQEVIEAVRGTTEKPIRFVLSPRAGLFTETGARIDSRSRLTIDDGVQRIEILPAGDGLVAYLPSARILFAGGVESSIAVLDELLELDVATVVPSRGGEKSRAWLAERRQSLVALGRHVEDGLRKNLSLEQITADAEEEHRPHVARVYDELTGRTPPALLRELGLVEERSRPRDKEGWTPPRKVIVSVDSPEQVAALQRVAPGVQVIAARDAAAAVAQVADADAVIGFCTPEIVRQGKKLRWIQVGSAGVERYLTIPELEQSPITLTNAQRLYGPQMAEHGLALALALTRGLRLSIPAQVEGTWTQGRRNQEAPFIELRGKVALVLGLGGIGAEIARRAHALDMTVLATRRKTNERPPYVQHIGTPAQSRELASRADVVFNCLPLTTETEQLCDESFFAAMKPSAYFINLGRGGTVVTDALVEALQQKKIAGAALDVTDPEPLPKDHALWRMSNVVITPHISARSDHGDERRFLLYRENLRRFALGEPLFSVVDKSAGY